VRLSAAEAAAAEELRDSWAKARAAGRIADPLKWDHAKLLAEKRTLGNRPVSWSKLAGMSDMSEPMCRQYVATWEAFEGKFQGFEYPPVPFDQARLMATEDLRAEQRTSNEFSIARRVLRKRGCDMAPELADTFDRYPGLLDEVIGLVDDLAMERQEEEEEEAVEAVDVTEEAEQEPEAEEAEEADWMPDAGEPSATSSATAPVPASPAPKMTEEEQAEARRQAAQVRRIAEFKTRVAAAPGAGIRATKLIVTAAHKHTPAAIENIELAETHGTLDSAHRLEYVKHVDAIGDFWAKLRRTSAYQKNRRMAQQRRQAGVEEEVVTE
jgi:hypothetical protein